MVVQYWGLWHCLPKCQWLSPRLEFYRFTSPRFVLMAAWWQWAGLWCYSIENTGVGAAGYWLFRRTLSGILIFLRNGTHATWSRYYYMCYSAVSFERNNVDHHVNIFSNTKTFRKKIVDWGKKNQLNVVPFVWPALFWLDGGYEWDFTFRLEQVRLHIAHCIHHAQSGSVWVINAKDAISHGLLTCMHFPLGTVSTRVRWDKKIVPFLHASL